MAQIVKPKTAHAKRLCEPRELRRKRIRRPRRAVVSRKHKVVVDLGSFEPNAAARSTRVLERRCDIQRAFVEIDVLPSQRQQLAAAQTSHRGHSDRHFELRALADDALPQGRRNVLL
ncbi:MAG TPA: hypothetical protein VIW73_10250 [Candidatus Cybelea sp.]